MRRVCGAAAQLALRTGSARCTCVRAWDPVLWGAAGGVFGSKGWTLKGLCSKGRYQMDGNTCGIGQKWENPFFLPNHHRRLPSHGFLGKDETPREGPGPIETVRVKHQGSPQPLQPICQGFASGLFARVG